MPVGVPSHDTPSREVRSLNAFFLVFRCDSFEILALCHSLRYRDRVMRRIMQGFQVPVMERAGRASTKVGEVFARLACPHSLH